VTDLTELRRRLELDAGYASRLLSKLEARGLLIRERSGTDTRRQVVRLTEAGHAAQHSLEQRTVAQIGALLDRLTDEDQHRLLNSMQAITTLVGENPAQPTVVLRNANFEALVARIVADYVEKQDPAREAAWIAELDGERAGCVFCVRGSEDHTAKLRLLLVEPSPRGHGLGRRLVDECVAFARGHGYLAMELWTNDELTSARRVYAKAGFQLVDHEPHRSFGHDLVGETWRLEW
jgi:GNAT superfamily N-acetyltransferase